MTLLPGAPNQYSSPRLPSTAPNTAPRPARLSHLVRGLLVAGGVLLVLLLGTALWLTPSAARRGTHQQLGLPTCTFLTYTGMRCPSCGMTTAWAHTLRGQLVAAVTANTGGTILALLALVCTPWLLVSGIRGSWLWRPPGEITMVVTALLVVAITLVDWGLRIAWKL